jgi:hypothetical protein
MNIETWQAALKERGNDAYKLFAWKKFSDGGLEDFISNDDLDKFMQETLGECIVLKPLDKLVEMDIERYGEKNVLLMYEFSGLGGDWQDIPVHANCADVLVALGNNFYEHRRKLYANAPFNIEWAQAGVAVEFLNPCSNAWELVIKKGDMNNEAMQIFFEQCPCGMWIVPVDLRHPFPPIKELGL